MLDFIGFINGEVSLTTEKKVAMLGDFVSQYGYQETVEDPEGGDPVDNPVSKSDFANEKIERFIIETVNATRIKVGRAAVEIEELELI